MIKRCLLFQIMFKTSLRPAHSVISNKRFQLRFLVFREVAELHTLPSHGRGTVGKFFGEFEIGNRFSGHLFQKKTCSLHEYVQLKGSPWALIRIHVTKGQAAFANINDPSNQAGIAT